MYLTKKKKREVDPNAPPRPTLLGHEKEMKMFRQQYKEVADQNMRQALTINTLQRKINKLQGQVDAMASIMSRKLK
jgi:hypothetical protein